MSEISKFNVLKASGISTEEYLNAPEEKQKLTLAMALVDSAKSAERLYREKPELFTAQLDELRNMGIEEPSLLFVLGFCSGGALMIDFLEQAKDTERRRSLFTVTESGKA